MYDDGYCSMGSGGRFYSYISSDVDVGTGLFLGCDLYLKYSFYPYALVSFSSVFMLNKFPNALKVHTYDQVIHLMELCKIGGKTTTEAATVF